MQISYFEMSKVSQNINREQTKQTNKKSADT